MIPVTKIWVIYWICTCGWKWTVIQLLTSEC